MGRIYSYRQRPVRRPPPVRAVAPVPVPTPEPVAVAAPEPDDFDYLALTKADVVEMAEAAGLDTSGTKAEVWARLVENGDV